MPAERSWIPAGTELPPEEDSAYVPSGLAESPRLRFPSGAIPAYEDSPPPQGVSLLAPYLTRTFRTDFDASTLADAINIGSLVVSAARDRQTQRAAETIETLTKTEFAYATSFMSHRQRYFVELLPPGSDWDQLIDVGLNALGAWEWFELGRLVAHNSPYGLLAEVGIEVLMALGISQWQDRSFMASAERFAGTIAGDVAAYEAQPLVNVLTANPEAYPWMFLAEPTNNLIMRLQLMLGLSLGSWIEQNLVDNVREVLGAESRQIRFGRFQRQAVREAVYKYIMDVMKLVRDTLTTAWDTANTPEFDGSAAGMWEYTLPAVRRLDTSPIMDTSATQGGMGPAKQLYTTLGSYADARDDIGVGGFEDLFAADTGGWSPQGSLYGRMLRLPSLGALVDTCLRSVALRRDLLTAPQEDTRLGERPLMGSVHTLRGVFRPLLAGAIPVGTGGWLADSPDQFVIPNWRNSVNIDRTDIGTIVTRVFGGGQGYEIKSLNFADKLTSFVYRGVSLLASYFRSLGVDKYIGMCSRSRRHRLLRWYNRGCPFYQAGGDSSRTVSDDFRAEHRGQVDTVVSFFASQNVGGPVTAPATEPRPAAPTIREPTVPPPVSPVPPKPSGKGGGMVPVFVLVGLGAMVLLGGGGKDANRR